MRCSCNGCTDPLYTEYDPLANTDDGSCTTLIVNGCTDSTAYSGYNPLANTDDGSCIAVVNGCTDSTAFNYNLLANTDDGSCVAVALGCTDPLYTEYDPLANTNDGSCTTLIVNGCTDSTAYSGYNPLANTDDGSCIPVVNGCTDVTALNYDALANTDDGSCTYTCTAAPYCENFDAGVPADWTNSGWALDAYNTTSSGTGPSDDITGGGNYMFYETSGSPQTPITLTSLCLDVSALTNPTLAFYNHMYGATMGTLEVLVNGASLWSMSGDQGDQWNFVQVDLSAYAGNTNITIDFVGTYGGGFTGDMAIDEVCVDEYLVIVNGCTDSTATNYDPLANTDDGSCIAVVNGCTDVTALNYDALANTDDGSCTYPCLLDEVTLNMFDSYGEGWNGGFLTVNGENYWITTGVAAVSDLCIDLTGCIDFIWTAGSYDSEVSWNVTDTSGAILASGIAASSTVGNCAVLGCTNSTAFNYNASANVDDGSCIAFVNGCTDPLYTEYDPLANTDDGTCITLNGCTDVMITVGGGNYDSEIGWSLVDGSGVTVAAGGAPYSAIACLFDDCYTMNMTDSWGDGWNGATYSITDNNSGTVYGTGGLIGSSSSGSDNISIGFACTVYGCTDLTATNYDATATDDDGSCCFNGICVGSTYQGGIIFWLDGNGGGLIAAPSDQSSGAQWGCFGTLISGADGTAIGTGNQNTIDIEAGCTTSGIAADICANLTLGGYSDWFLPSKDEIKKMYSNIGQGNALGLGNVGNFDNVAPYGYWSSTEFGYSFAWRQDFGSGSQIYSGVKNNSANVRAVRAF